MGARQKLNRIHFAGSMAIACLVGMLAESGMVCILALTILLLIDLATGVIRRSPSREEKEAHGNSIQTEHQEGKTSMKDGHPSRMIATGSIVVAAICTLLVQGAWVIWIPTILALAVFAAVDEKPGR